MRTLDATAGLSRLGEHDGVLFWRVLPGGGGSADDSVAPSRARVVTKAGQRSLPVTGDHGRLETAVDVPAGICRLLDTHRSEAADAGMHVGLRHGPGPFTEGGRRGRGGADHPVHATAAGARSRTGADRVSVLLFVNRPTTNKQVKQPVVYKDQVTVTMQKVGDSWLVDDLVTSPAAG